MTPSEELVLRRNGDSPHLMSVPPAGAVVPSSHHLAASSLALHAALERHLIDTAWRAAGAQLGAHRRDASMWGAA